MATCAEKIAEWLHEKGITHAFGVVGGGNIAIWDAITRAKKTHLVCVHHEQAAAMAAAYYYRASGRLALCLVTTGGGSSNAITGVLAAFMDRTPLIVISGNEASKYMGVPTRVLGVQGYPNAHVARSFTKDAIQPNAAFSVLDCLQHAYDVALAAPQGSVWVDICKDYQSARL